VLRAAAQVSDEGIGVPVLIGRSDVICGKLDSLGLTCGELEIVSPDDFERIDEYAQAYFELRQRKGLTLRDAHQAMRNPNVFAPMMVYMKDAHACISGLTYHYPDVIRPALQIHHAHPDAGLAAGVYIMIVNDRTYLFTDATVNIDPTAEDLAKIACLAADFARQLGLEPRAWRCCRSRILAARRTPCLPRCTRRWKSSAAAARTLPWMARCRRIRPWCPRLWMNSIRSAR
jgi:malate dehydrogenase (oxaloacetate-decarboxylating)(NADP+)